MTIGISKERLLRKLVYMPVGISDYDRGRNAVLNELLIECTELNPWQPIESAPKDRRILLWFPESSDVTVGKWYDSGYPEPNVNTYFGTCENMRNHGRATHWMELPEGPK